MTEQELDKVMQRILNEAVKKDAAEVTADVTLQFCPSMKYQHSIREMLKNPVKWAKKKERPIWKAALQKVAVLLIVLSLSLGSLMGVSPTVRAAVIKWVTEVYENLIVYRYFGEDISGEMPEYGIEALPQGYTETIRDVFSATVSVVYESSEGGDMICLTYTSMQQGATNQFVPGDDDIIQVEVNGMRGTLFVPQDTQSAKVITWIDEDANIQFVINAFCDEKTMLDLAESVHLEK